MTAVDVASTAGAGVGGGVLAGVALAPGVRIREARTCTLVLAGDGTTVLAFGPEDLALLAGPGGPARDDLVEEMASCGMVAGSLPRVRERPVALTRSGVEVEGFDALARRVVGVAGRVPGRVWLMLAVVLGAWGLAGGRFLSSAEDAGVSALQAAAVLVAVELGLMVVHELGHAAVLVRAGGRVGRVGFGFHWGAPSFYVDASAALFLPRRARIWQAAAGVVIEAAAVGALVVAAVVTGSPVAGYVAGAAAVVALGDLVVNAAPVLGLDGSWILADVLDRPTMPTGSGRAVDGRERRYRAVNGVVGVAAIGVSVWLWSVLWWELLAPLWDAGLAGRVVAVVTVAPTVIAVAVGVATALWAGPSPELQGAAAVR